MRPRGAYRCAHLKTSTGIGDKATTIAATLPITNLARCGRAIPSR